MIEPEIVAISKCYELFEPLEDDSKIRVIQWLIGKFKLNTSHTYSHVTDPGVNSAYQEEGVKLIPIGNSNREVIEINPVNKSIEDFESVAEFFAYASPNSDWEKVLVVSTYLQVKNGLSDFTSFVVNKELKNLGHGFSNITRPIDSCIERKPQLILQLRKEGKSRQAQKKYKVSGEGIKVIKAMLSKAQ